MPVTGIDTLAPDQRAAVQLVLARALRSELSEMLGMPEETIRARARGGLEALAPDLPAPSRAGEIADWLLGQQSEKHAARTRELLLSDPNPQEWAATGAPPLRKVPGGTACRSLAGESQEPTSARGQARPPRTRKSGHHASTAPSPGSAARC